MFDIKSCWFEKKKKTGDEKSYLLDHLVDFCLEMEKQTMTRLIIKQSTFSKN
jgi:hypothetical protein